MKEMFLGQVPRALKGYCWRTNEQGEHLLGPVYVPSSSWLKNYDPFSEAPGLFLVFARLEPTEDAIVGFANAYGITSIRMPDWEAEIRDMRNAIELWQAVETKNEELLAKHVHWDNERDGVRFSSPLTKKVRHRVKGTLPNAGIELGRYKQGDLWEPAQLLLDGVIYCNASWQNVSLIPTRRQSGLTYQILLNSQPDPLLDVIWAQFALAVAESQEFRFCKLCNRPFEVAPQTNRTDRVFCSDTCRVKSYQRRQAKARKMRAAGKKLRDIAKEVETDMRTVKRWVGEGK